MDRERLESTYPLTARRLAPQCAARSGLATLIELAKIEAEAV